MKTVKVTARECEALGADIAGDKDAFRALLVVMELARHGGREHIDAALNAGYHGARLVEAWKRAGLNPVAFLYEARKKSTAGRRSRR